MHGKVGVDTGKASNEGAFPGVDGFFRRIRAVQVGGGELVSCALRAHEGFEAFWAFVVEDMQDRVKATVGKMLVQFGKGTDEFVLTAGLEGFGKYVVAVVIVQNHEIIIPSQ